MVSPSWWTPSPGPSTWARSSSVRRSNVDPRTAQLSVVSDPFPTIVKGVPLHIRSVRVAIDKPHFMVSPTNCSKQQVGGTATSVDGPTAPLQSRFQVGSCKNLKFSPKLSLSAGGTGSHETGELDSAQGGAARRRRVRATSDRLTVSIQSPPISALLNVVQQSVHAQRVPGRQMPQG